MDSLTILLSASPIPGWLHKYSSFLCLVGASAVVVITAIMCKTLQLKVLVDIAAFAPCSQAENDLVSIWKIRRTEAEELLPSRFITAATCRDGSNRLLWGTLTHGTNETSIIADG